MSKQEDKLRALNSTSNGFQVLVFDLNAPEEQEPDKDKINNMSSILNYYPWLIYTKKGGKDLCMHHIDKPSLMFKLQNRYPIFRFCGTRYYD